MTLDSIRNSCDVLSTNWVNWIKFTCHVAQAVTAQMVSIFEGLIPANSVLGETVDQDAGGEKPGTRHELNRLVPIY